ncbi:MAG TPA: DUF2993 domain-containing protein [Acidimicrobiales bacterium]|nr:DUF2993 domain-containing protein [Acidimicrobiales bacterium]
MRKLLALGIVLTILGAVDQGARVFAENKLEEKARAEARGASSVEASISSFPFLGRLLVSGNVSTVEVRAEQATLSDLLSGSVEVDLRGVRLERDALFSGKVRLQRIDAGTVAVELDAAGLGRVLKLPVTIEDGQVRLTVAGRTVTARAAVVAGELVLQMGALPALSVPITRNGLMNCTAADAEVRGDTIRLTCAVDEVPPALLR